MGLFFFFLIFSQAFQDGLDLMCTTPKCQLTILESKQKDVFGKRSQMCDSIKFTNRISQVDKLALCSFLQDKFYLYIYICI